MKAKPSQPAPAAPTPKPKRRRWRRRLVVSLAILVGLAILFRMALPWIVPPVIAKVAAAYRLSCTYEDLDFTFFGADAELWQLVIAPLEGGEPIVEAEYCRADISLLALLTGRLVIHRLESDGMDVLIERDEHGRFPLLERLVDSNRAGQAAVPEGTPAPAAGPAGAESKPPPVDLTPFFAINALRLQYLEMRIRDRTVVPPFESRFDVNLRLSNFGSSNRRFRFELGVDAAGVLDALTVEGTARHEGRDLDANLRVSLQGFHAAPLATHLAALGIRPAAKAISFEMDARAAARAAPGGAEDVQTELTLEKVAVAADGEEALALDKLVLSTEAIGYGGLSLGTLAIEGARIFAQRMPSGALRFAGFELGPTLRPAATAPAPPPPPPGAPLAAAPARPAAPPPAGGEPAPGAPARPFPIILKELKITGARAAIRDAAVKPEADLALELKEFRLTDIAFDPSRPEAAAGLSAELAAPGLIEKITVAGTAGLTAPRRSIEVDLSATGVTASALKGHLASLGLEPALESGSFACRVAVAAASLPDGRFGAEAHLTGISFKDREELFSLSGAHLEGMVIDPKTLAVRIGTISVEGPSIEAERDATGSLRLLGLKTAPRAPAGGKPSLGTGSFDPSEARIVPASFPAAPPRATAPAESAPPAISSTASITVERLLWKGLKARFRDGTFEPPVTLAIADGGIEVHDLALDLDPTAAPAAPGRLRAWLAVPGCIESIEAAGTFVAKPSAPSVALAVSAKGITAASIAPYLKAAGLEPELKDGTFALKLEASAAIAGESIGGSLSVEDVAFQDQGSELLGLAALRVRGAKLEAGEIRIESIEVASPRARIARGKKSSAPTAPPPAAALAPPPRAGLPSLEIPMPALPRASLEKFLLHGASLAWSDAAVSPPVATTVTARAEARGLVLGKEAPPASFEAEVKVDDVLSALRVAGTLTASPARLGAALDVSMEGLHAGPLAAYLPPGVALELKDGRLRTHLEAEIASNPEGGRSARLIASGTEFREGPAEAGGRVFLAVESARCIVGRSDPAARIFAVDEVSLTGFDLDVERRDGGTSLLALSIQPVTPPQPPATDAAAPGKGTSKEEPPSPPPAPATGPATAPRATPPAPRPPEKLPLITLAKLEVGVRRLSVRNAARAEAPPIVASLALRNRKPIELLGEDPDSRPPMELELAAQAAPILEALNVEVTCAPFALEPEVRIAATGAGIRGEGLTAALPEIAPWIDGKGLTDGRFRAGIETSFKVQRRGIVDLGLGRPFGLDFRLKAVEFKNGEAGPVLAGLDDLLIDVAKVDLKTGGVHVRAVEIVKPKAIVERSKEGIHALGLTVKLPEEAPPGDSGGEPAQAPPPDGRRGAAAPPSPPAARPGAPGPEVRIDKLFVSGIEVDVHDRATEIPCIIPLRDASVEVRDLTTRALFADHPIRFNSSLRSTKVPLRKAIDGGTLVGAATDSPASTADGTANLPRELEQRDLFHEMSVSGKIGLFPRISGWVKASVSALDLAGLAGPASEAGVALNGGVFDAALDVRFTEKGALALGTRLVFTDLDVSEADDGPISSHLHLPAPLNGVVFLLRDESGALEVPFNVEVQPNDLSLSAIAGAALQSMGKVIGSAFTNATVRLAKAPTNLIGLTGKEEEKPEEPIVLEFAAGEQVLRSGMEELLARAIARLKDDERLAVSLSHELGGGDIAAASRLANPSKNECLELARALRSRRAKLLADRDAAAEEARACFASRLIAKAEDARRKVRGLEGEIGMAEESLDSLYAMQRPGAERLAPRRTREFCLSLARLRLIGVRDALAAAVPGTERIDPLPRPRFAEPSGEEGGRVKLILRARKAR